MADLNLKLEENAATTMPTVGQVRRVRVPAAARTLVFSSDNPFYWETPAATKADAAAIDATRSLYMPAGLYDVTLTGDGQTDVPRARLGADTYYYFSPTVAGQAISLRASKVG